MAEVRQRDPDWTPPAPEDWTLEDSIQDILRVSYYWPDGIHTREELGMGDSD